MTEPDSIGEAIATEALNSVAGPVKTSFFKAVGHLLGGLTAIPAAKLKQYAQGIEDATTARSMTTAIMAKAAADEARADPLLVQAAVEVFLPSALRKAKNRLSVAQSAAEHLVQTSDADTGGKHPASPNDDWMNSFTRFAEDASSERMQDLFGRILAGEVLRPGAFGLATLRTLSELDQAIANDFTQAWGQSVGDAVDYGHEWQRGEGFSRWKRLSEVGLMAPTSISQFLPPFTPVLNGNAMWAPMQADGIWLNVLFQQGSSTQWRHIEFTRVGREIGSILPKPDYEENMRKAANRLPKDGVTRIELYTAGKAAEVLWQAAP